MAGCWRRRFAVAIAEGLALQVEPPALTAALNSSCERQREVVAHPGDFVLGARSLSSRGGVRSRAFQILELRQCHSCAGGGRSAAAS